MGMFGSLKQRFDPNQGGIAMKDRALAAIAAMNGDMGGAMQIKDAARRRPEQADAMAALEALFKPQAQAYHGTAGPTMDGSEPAAQAIPEEQRTQYQPDMRDPRAQQALFQAQRARIDPSLAMKMLEANRPNVQFSPSGEAVDTYDRRNVGRVFPKMGEGIQALPGGGAKAVEGYADAAAGIAGATTGAQEQQKAAYDLVDVPSPNGGTIKMPRLMAAQILGKQAMGGAGQGLGHSQTPDDAAYAGDLAKASAKQYTDIQTVGQRAPSVIASYSRMNQLLDGLQTGRLTPAAKEVASVASSLGIKIDPKWGNVEAANAIAQKLSLDAMGGSLGAGFSNADRSFVESMNPAVAQTPQGRAQIIKFGVARAKREQEVAQKARQWQQRAGRLDKPDRNGKTFFDYLDAYAEANPLAVQ